MGTVDSEERETNLGRTPQISQFLSAVQAETAVAPVLQAGFAQRNGNCWSFSWGGTGAVQDPIFFDLASVTKPHFAVCVARQVEKGVLRWDTLLEELLPEVEGTHAGKQTVEALLSHRSGLRPHIELFRDSWSGAPISRVRCLRAAASALQKGAATAPFDPLYSDLGYILLGFALTRHLSSDLDHLVVQSVLNPWNLRSGSARCLRRRHVNFGTRVARTEVQPPRGGLLAGVVHDDNAWALGGTGLCGHAGLFGTVLDVLKFGAQMLDGLSGSRGPTEASTLLPLIRKRPGGTLRMGFDGVSGPNSMAGTRAGTETFGHLGFTGTSFWCDPGTGRVTALLTNRVYPTRDNPRIRAVRPKIHDFLWSC